MKTVIASTLVVAILSGGFWYRHHVYETGYSAGVAFQKDLGDKALAQANADNRKEADDLQDRVDTANTNAVLKDEQHAKDLEGVRAAARAGAVRLSIPGACRANASTQAGPAPAAGAEERTDLLPGTADDILRIAGHAAQDVRDYNNLLDQYNTVCK